MQMLYPIIRRVRRSLVVTEAGPDTQGTGGHGVPRPTGAARQEPRPTSLEVEDGKKSDEKVSTNTDAR